VPCAYLADTLDSDGFIGLQVHSIGNNEALAGKKIYFKNIKIKTGALQPSAFPKGIYVVNTLPNSLTTYEEQSWLATFV